MTLIQMADKVYRASYGHMLNGEKKTKKDFRDWFVQMFANKKRKVLFSMSFPDGDWLCIAERGSWGFDYIVPDTREQETKMFYRFFEN